MRNIGGVLEQQLHALEIKVLPADIPEMIEIDVTSLAIGQSLFVQRPDRRQGRHRHRRARQTVAVVAAPRAEETPVAAAAEAPARPSPN